MKKGLVVICGLLSIAAAFAIVHIKRNRKSESIA